MTPFVYSQAELETFVGAFGLRKENLSEITIRVPVKTPVELVCEYSDSAPGTKTLFSMDQKERQAFAKALGVPVEPVDECFLVKIKAAADKPVELVCSFYARDKEGMVRALSMLNKGNMLK